MWRRVWKRGWRRGTGRPVFSPFPLSTSVSISHKCCTSISNSCICLSFLPPPPSPSLTSHFLFSPPLPFFPFLLHLNPLFTSPYPSPVSTYPPSLFVSSSITTTCISHHPTLPLAPSTSSYLPPLPHFRLHLPASPTSPLPPPLLIPYPLLPPPPIFHLPSSSFPPLPPPPPSPSLIPVLGINAS